MFDAVVRNCKIVASSCSYLEVFVFEDETHNELREGALAEKEIGDWLHQYGSFRATYVPSERRLLGCLRLLVQKDCDGETFEAGVLSMPAAQYQDMVRTFDLSYRQLETAHSRGPFLWSVSCNDREHEHLQLIYHNTYGSKVKECQGIELSLAYSPTTNITTGFFRGSRDSLLQSCIDHLKSSLQQSAYPLFLPRILLEHEMNAMTTSGYQCSLKWLGDVEDALSKHTGENPSQRTLCGMTKCERELLQIHNNVMRRHPQALLEVVRNFAVAVEEFSEVSCPDALLQQRLYDQQVSKSCMRYYKMKLDGINTEIVYDLSRIDILRSILQNQLSTTLAQMQEQSDTLKHQATLRYSQNQQTLGVLGALFLPGTFYAAIFSTTFFDFRDPESTAIVSAHFWIFWALTIPTMVLIFIFLFVQYLRSRSLAFFRIAEEDTQF